MADFIAYCFVALVFLVASALQHSPNGLNAPQCRWSVSAPQLPLDRATCSTPFDDKSAGGNRNWGPWTTKPYCSNKGRWPLCVFASSSFRGQRGISIVATPVDAANIANAMDDPYYTWERGVQALDPRLMQKHESTTWQLKGKPGKNLRVVAKRTIMPGEVIMLDYPVMIIPPRFASLQQEDELLNRASSDLPDQSLVFNLSLSAAGEDDVSRMKNVFQTNAFSTQIGTNQYMLLYPKVSSGYTALASLIGHGGNRNAKDKEETGDNNQLSKSKAAKSDERREKIRIYVKQLQSVEDDIRRTDLLATGLIRLVEKEGLTSSLGDYYELIALAYLRSGHTVVAKEYVEKSVEFWNLYDIHERERVTRAKRFLKKLNEVESILEDKKKPQQTQRTRV